MLETLRQEKDLLAFNKGLNTEASEIQFPDGFTTDERNYELQLDGSRRRRKGLAQESGGSDKTTAADACGDYNSTFVWKNVGGNPQKTFIVHKFGSVLYFTDDAETISTTYHASTIELDNYKVSASSVSADTNPAHFGSGRGYLVVTGPGHYPLVIEYSSTTDAFSINQIDPLIRDYTDQEDGTTNSYSPTTLSDATRYNLLNRGWRQADIDAYFAAAAVYPNKSVPWHKGYKETADQSTPVTTELIGIKAFDDALYTSQPASTSSAPRGALFVRPISSSYAASDAVTTLPVLALVFPPGNSAADASWTLQFTIAAGHGIVATDVIEIKDTQTHYYITGDVVDEWKSWAGQHTVTAVDQDGGNNVEIVVTKPADFSTMIDLDYTKGSVVTDSVINRGTGSLLALAPRVNAFHDGRVFYAGMDAQEWSDYVFFTQIPDGKTKFANCYQEADPTDPENNQLVDTDGGWFVIQGIQGVKKLLSVRSSLLAFAENGVWEISGGQRGFFTPSGYSIRKITDVGCSSPYSPIAVENAAIYTGPEGIYRIAPNQYTGILEAESISIDLVQSKWNAIADAQQQRVMSVYDGATKRLWFLYGKSTGTGTNAKEFYYNKALILTLSIPAYSYYEYNSAQYTGIISAYALTATDTTDQTNKIKFSCGVTNGTTVRTCDHNQTDYIDYNGSESPLPYVVTGWDSFSYGGLSKTQDTQRRRQAPIITVYSKRTETGYTDSGTGWTGDNESSTLMSAFWDWTEAIQWTDTDKTAQETWDATGDATNPSISGKIDNQQQVYRHTRAFTPSSATDVDGYPVVVTRNKVRGRGRVLQLRFDGAATKDSHILGFTTNYRAQRSY